MKNKHEALVAASRQYGDLMKQQQHLVEKGLPAIRAEYDAVAKRLAAARREKKEQMGYELRGVASPADVSAATQVDDELTFQLGEIAERLSLAEEVQANLASTISESAREARSALVEYVDEVSADIEKAVNVDKKLRARMIELAAGKMLANQLQDGIFAERFWDRAVVHLFPTPDGEEMERAIAAFRENHDIPVLGR